MLIIGGKDTKILQYYQIIIEKMSQPRNLGGMGFLLFSQALWAEIVWWQRYKSVSLPSN